LKAFQDKRITAVDLDPDEDRQISLQEFLIFGYKNMGFILNMAAAGGMILQV
jgi:hypothetical protein